MKLLLLVSIILGIFQSQEVFGCGGGSRRRRPRPPPAPGPRPPPPTGGRKCFVQICSSNPSNQIRGTDAWGSGAFGAPRRRRTHKGVDIVCSAGSSVYTPFPARVVRGLTVYSQRRHIGKPYNTGIVLSGTGAWAGYQVKMFYVSKRVSNGAAPRSGNFIGIMTDRAAADPGMTNHVHVELYRNGALQNPTSLVRC